MSRSRKKVARSSTNPGSMKWWKRCFNKRLRLHSKETLRRCADYDALVMPRLNEVSTLYDTPLDGGIAPRWTAFQRWFEYWQEWLPGEAKFDKMKRK